MLHRPRAHCQTSGTCLTMRLHIHWRVPSLVKVTTSSFSSLHRRLSCGGYSCDSYAYSCDCDALSGGSCGSPCDSCDYGGGHPSGQAGQAARCPAAAPPSGHPSLIQYNSKQTEGHQKQRSFFYLVARKSFDVFVLDIDRFYAAQHSIPGTNSVMNVGF